MPYPYLRLLILSRLPADVLVLFLTFYIPFFFSFLLNCFYFICMNFIISNFMFKGLACTVRCKLADLVSFNYFRCKNLTFWSSFSHRGILRPHPFFVYELHFFPFQTLIIISYVRIHWVWWWWTQHKVEKISENVWIRIKKNMIGY